MSKLKSIFVSLTAMLFGVSAAAQVWTLKNRESSSCDPKPYITFKFINGADTLFLGSDANATPATAVNIRTASNVSYSVGGGAPVSVPFFTNLDKADSTLTYFLHDMYYLPAGAEVSVSVPAFSLRTPDGAAIKQDAQIRTFTVDDVYEVKSSVRSSAIAEAAKGKSIVVKSPNVLTVDGELACKQLVVEPRLDDVNGNDSTRYAAGVEVLAGGALIVSDTAYYLCHRYDNHASAYLINRGTYSAGGNVFTKNADNTLNHEYAKKYGHWNTKSDRPDNNYYLRLPGVAFPVKSLDRCFAFNHRTSKFNVFHPRSNNSAEDYKNYLGSDVTALNERIDTLWYLNYAYGYSAITFRAKGEIFDENSTLRNITYNDILRTRGSKSIYRIGTTVNNVYGACVDWRGVIDNVEGENVASKLRSMHIMNINPLDGYDYNFQTGLTTYDGSMGLGYIQPAMEAAYFLQQDYKNNEVSYVEITKSDIISLKQAEERYPVDSLLTDLPYVRFYVDDPEMPKGQGKRSVFVAYFLPDEKVDELHSEADPDYSSLGFNMKWETLASDDFMGGNSAGGGIIFPFVLGRNDLDDAGLSIKMFSMQEGDNDQVWSNGSGAVKIFIDPSQTRVEFGVLDYAHLGRLVVTCGPLSINNADRDDDVRKSVITSERFSDFGIKTGKLYSRACKLLMLELETKLNPKRQPSSIVEPGNATVFVQSENNGITIKANGKCEVLVSDLAGRSVCEKSLRASGHISLPSGIYLVRAKSEESTVHKKILVK